MMSSSSPNHRNHHHGNTKKRKFACQPNGRSKNNPHPLRGGPGILVTCEAGQERKCRHQLFPILEYYYYCCEKKPQVQQPQPNLTLEQELVLLKQPAKLNPDSLPFEVYETGCRGTVFVICTLPGAEWIPTIPSVAEYRSKMEQSNSNNSNDKRTKWEDDDLLARGDSKFSATASSPLWDPLATVQSVIEDVLEEARVASSSASGAAGALSVHNIPTSRFVTRMIPIQATCFANPTEIQQTTASLVQKYVSYHTPTTTTTATTTTTTFAVRAKARNCEHWKHQHELVDCVATQVLAANITEHPHHLWKVDLRQPQVTVWVEVCQTLCGISIIPQSLLNLARNFNLAELRDKTRSAAAE